MRGHSRTHLLLCLLTTTLCKRSLNYCKQTLIHCCFNLSCAQIGKPLCVLPNQYFVMILVCLLFDVQLKYCPAERTSLTMFDISNSGSKRNLLSYYTNNFNFLYKFVSFFEYVNEILK